MVSWFKAYRRALWIVAYSLIFWMIGGYIFIAGFKSLLWSGGTFKLFIMLLGVAIASLGPIAAIIKISAETKD